MNTYTISQKTKNKHLKFHHYEYIINEIIRFTAENKGHKRNTGKTKFIKNIANTIGTSVSNIYSIINDASISVRDTHLNEHIELSALAAFEKRSKNHKIPNNSKLVKAHDFIMLVEDEMKSNRLSSVDETIHHLILHKSDMIRGMQTISTKTFYNYIHGGKVAIKPIDLTRMMRRKNQKNWKTYSSPSLLIMEVNLQDGRIWRENQVQRKREQIYTLEDHIIHVIVLPMKTAMDL